MGHGRWLVMDGTWQVVGDGTWQVVGDGWDMTGGW